MLYIIILNDLNENLVQIGIVEENTNIHLLIIKSKVVGLGLFHSIRTLKVYYLNLNRTNLLVRKKLNINGHLMTQNKTVF